MSTHVAFLDRGRLLFQETMEALTDRLRQVHVTLDRGGCVPLQLPAEWLDFRLSVMEARPSEVAGPHSKCAASDAQASGHSGLLWNQRPYLQSTLPSQTNTFWKTAPLGSHLG